MIGVGRLLEIIGLLLVLNTAAAALLLTFGSALLPQNEITFVVDNRLYSLDVPRGIIHKFAAPGQITSARWSPNGRQLLLRSIYEDNFGELYVMNASGSGLRRLTSNEFREDGMAWSPDGTYIVFSSENFDGTASLHMLETATGFIRQMTPNNGRYKKPVWSPDSRYIAFESDYTGMMGVYVMPVDGSVIQLVSGQPQQDSTPAWSPDGRVIAFESRRDGGGDIFMVMLENGSINKLTGSGYDRFPRWSPNGRYIVYESTGIDGSDIYLIDIENSQTRMLTTQHLSFINENPMWSPDGRHLIFITGLLGQARASDYRTYLFDVESGLMHQLGVRNSRIYSMTWRP